MPDANDDRSQFDPRYQTERIGFDAGEMQKCGKCGRDNPPNKAKCFYCGGELAIRSTSTSKLSLRKLEPWEKGWNVIITNATDAKTAEIGGIVGMENDEASQIIAASVSLPIARVGTQAEADAVRQSLEPLGCECRVISDESLSPDKMPIRLGGVEFLDDGMRVLDFNTGKGIAIAADDLALIVVGELMIEKTDKLEKKRRRNKAGKLLDEVQTASDEPVVDIYSRQDATGYRVNLAGFDFSCLGDSMGLFASENIRGLVAELHARFPDAGIVADYSHVRHVLDPVWEVESRKDSGGLQRAGFGKVEFGSTESRSNLRQFTNYSRMQWHLL